MSDPARPPVLAILGVVVGVLLVLGAALFLLALSVLRLGPPIEPYGSWFGVAQLIFGVTLAAAGLIGLLTRKRAESPNG